MRQRQLPNHLHGKSCRSFGLRRQGAQEEEGAYTPKEPASTHQEIKVSRGTWHGRKGGSTGFPESSRSSKLLHTPETHAKALAAGDTGVLKQQEEGTNTLENTLPCMLPSSGGHHWGS